MPTTSARKQLGDLFAALGFAMWMADEAKLAALGSVAGAGPAYVARFVAALAKAGEKRGLTAEIAVDDRARNRARHGLDGGGDWRRHGLDRDAASPAPRARPRPASPCSTDDDVLDQLVAVTIDAAARRGAELADGGAEPRYRLPRLRRA